MEADLKKILKAVVLEMRHELEGYYDNAGNRHPGDLETRLAEIGVRKDRTSVPVDELGRLTEEDVHARKIVDAFIDVREQAGVDRATAVAEYIRESAYTWANRLVALRCMEARELLDDEVIVGREAYGGRSLVHHRLAQSSPELCTGEDDGRFAMLGQVFAERATTLPMLFDLDSPSIALRPSAATLKNCLAWLSGTQKVRSQEPASDAVFSAPDALGWAYQYWNTEEKDRVFETVRTKKGAKIEGADIIPATQLYTEDYMVKFLVQNSLGATWMCMHPESKLSNGWEYYVRDADRVPAKKKPLQKVSLLDPACGSGHFLIEAFDMFYAMYEEEGSLKDPEAICKSILENNLFGIDIDERAIQIAEASLWMKAEERTFGFSGANTNLVAATSSHLKGDSWERFLTTFEKEPHIPRVLREFARSIEHIDELGSLARPFEALEEIIKAEHESWEKQERDRLEGGNFLFKELRDDVLATLLPFQDISDKEFFERTMRHALFAIDGFTKDARESGGFNDQIVGAEAKTGFRLLDTLSKKFDIVLANPPYMGSQSMGPVLQNHIESNWKYSKRDLYAAFIARANELSSSRVGLVTQQAWLFLKQMHHLRDAVLPDLKIETLAHLGPGAFHEISGAHVNVVLYTGAISKVDSDHTTSAIRPEWMSGPDNIDAYLKRAQKETNLIIRVRQSDLMALPLRQFIYWCPSHFLGLIREEATLDQSNEVTYTASANTRFIRCFWECPQILRWRTYSKGGGFRKWEGLNTYRVDWALRGERVSAHIRDTYPPDKFSLWVKQPPANADTAVWSEIGSGSLGVRRACSGTVISRTGPAVFSSSFDELSTQLLLLNSRVSTYLLRLTCSGLHFAYPYVAKIPFPGIESQATLVDSVLLIAKRLTSYEILAPEFDDEQLLSPDAFLKRCEDETRLLIFEGMCEQIAFSAFRLNEECRKAVLTDTGIPASWRAMREGDFDPGLFENLDSTLLSATSRFVENLPRKAVVSVNESLVRQFFERHTSDESDASEDESGDENDEDEQIVSRLPIPTCSLIDAISEYADLNPLTVLSQLRELYAKDRELFATEDWKISTDRVTVVVLRLLGFVSNSKTKQEAYVNLTTDSEGIIPLTDVINESTLQERVIKVFQKDKNNDEAQNFAKLAGKSVADWLTNDFFTHQVKQFKRRPIAWQLQSSNFSSRKKPAFACLSYYHDVDVDTLAKIRSQYTGPLRVRCETELRGISATTTSERSDRHAKRSVELEESIAELQAFDTKLAAVAKYGFCPDSLKPTLRQYAFDEAMLSMKSRWLTRLSELMKKIGAELAGTNEAGWGHKLFNLDPATLNELHPSLGTWISDSLMRLDHYCIQVGPKAPNAANTEADPTADDFAKLIQSQSQLMVAKTIDLTCEVWFGKFADAELKPRKEKIKALKEEQKAIKEEIKRLKVQRAQGDTSPNREDEEPFALQQKFIDGRLSNMLPADRVRQLTAEIKAREQELKKTETAVRAIRESIVDWSSDEASTWGEWLAIGPMFDQVSSLDERRIPPKTIADFIAQESLYAPDTNDGVRVNIAPLQKAGLLAAEVLAAKDVDKAIADRAKWRADERRWVREGKLPQPGWWKQVEDKGELQEDKVEVQT